MNKKYLITLVAGLALAGCASHGSHNEAAAPAPVDTTMNSNASQSNELGAEAALEAELAHNNKVYFTFDSSDIDTAGTATIQNFAKFLVAHPTAKIHLAGNTDERGSREYNLGLGERRDNAVASALQAQGVSKDQISATSYGKERPVCHEHSEDCWHLNRRVDITRQ